MTSDKNSKTNFQKFLLNKNFIGLFTFIFTYSQAMPVSMAVAPSISLEESISQSVAVKTADVSVQEKVAAEPQPQTSQDFLMQEEKIAKLVTIAAEEDEEIEEDVVEEESASPLVKAFQELLEKAKALAQQGQAVAAQAFDKIASVSASDIAGFVKAAVEKGIEVGLAVVRGVLTLFTSYQADSVTVNDTLKEKLDNLDDTKILLHVQPRNADPSLIDIQEAGDRGAEEYVATVNDKDELSVIRYQNEVTEKNAIADFVAQVNQALNPVKEAVLEVKNWIEKASLDLTRVYYRSEPPTPMPNEPAVGTFASNAPTGIVNVNQPSNAEFRMNYDFTAAGSFGGAIINWGVVPAGSADFSVAATGQKFIFNLRTNNLCTTSNCVKIEFVDTAGRLAAVFVSGLNTTYQQVDIYKTRSGGIPPQGTPVLNEINPSIDFSKIKQINFVIDNALANPDAGFLDVQTGGGLAYLPVVTGTAYVQANLTNLPGFPILGSGEGGDTDNDASLTLNQTSSSDISITSITPDAGDFEFVSASFQGNQSLTQVVLAATIPSGKQLKVEIKDVNGKTADYLLTGTGAKQNYTLTLNAANVPPGFDNTKLTQVVFVADQTYIGSTSVTIPIETAGLDFTPTINGTTYNQAALTTLPGIPGATLASGEGGDVDNDASIIVSQTSASDFSFTTVIPDDGEFEFVSANLNTAQSIGSSLTIAATIPNGKTVKLEIQDSTGKILKFFLNGTGAKLNYTVNITTLGGFNVNSVARFVLVAEKSTLGNATVAVETKNLDFVPTITGAAYNQAALSTLAGVPGPALGSGEGGDTDNDASIVLNQTDESNFSFTTVIPDAEDFEFVTGTFAGLQTQGGSLTFAATIPNGKTVQFELHDKNNVVQRYLLLGTGAKQNYTVSITNVYGFDASSLVRFVFVADKAKTGDATVAVETKNLDFTPAITGTTYVQANLSTLPGAPALGSGEGGDTDNDASIIVNQTSANDFSFTTVIPDAEDFEFVTATFNGFQTLGSSFVFAATIPNGKTVKFELHDKNGVVRKYSLIGTSSKQNYTLPIAANVPPGFDPSSLARFVLVADQGSLGSGTVTIETRGLDFVPTVAGTAYNQAALTSLPNTPVLGSGEGGDTDNDASITVNQTSPNDFSFTSVIPDAVDFEFVTATFNRPSSVGSSLVFAATIENNERMKVEVYDINGAVADFILLGTGSKLNYTLALSGGNIPAGFDINNLVRIVFVSDQATMGTNSTVVIETKGLDFLPTVTGTAYNQAAITSLPNTPVLSNGEGGDTDNDASIIVNQTSPNDFSFVSTTPDAVDFEFVTATFNNFASLGSSLTFAATIENNERMKVEVHDKNGNVADFSLLGTGAKLNYTLALSGGNIPAGFDINNLARIVFVSDLATMGASSTVVIETKGLDFAPTVTGTAYNQALITSLPSLPVLGNGEGGDVDNDASIVVNQTSPNDFSFVSTTPDAVDFEFVTVAFNGFVSVGNSLTFAATIENNERMKVEVHDKNGNVADFFLTGTGARLNYTLALSGGNIPAGFDINNLVRVVFVSDLATMGATSTVVIETKGLDFLPTVTGTAYNQAALTSLPNTPVLSNGEGGDVDNDASIIVNQTSPNDFSFVSTTPDAVDFEFVVATFNNFASVGSSLTFAATIENNERMKVEVHDKNGNVADFSLTGTGTKLNYTLALSGGNIPAGFDINNLARIVFVSDLATMGASSTVVIETKGLDFAPTVTGTAYNQALITSLPNTPVLSSGEGGDTDNDASITVNQTSPNDFSFTSTTPDAVDFEFVVATFNNFASLGSSLTFAATIENNERMKVEVHDKNGNVADFFLVGTGAKLNYTLALSGGNIPAGFDINNLARIVFVSDQATMGTNSTVTIETKGLDFAPVVTGTAYNQAAITTLPTIPTLGSGEGGDTDNDASIIINQTSTNDFSFVSTTPDAVDFEFVTVNFNGFTTVGSSLVFAATIENSEKLKVEVHDKNGNVADFFLLGTGSKLNYTLALSGGNIPAGFDINNLVRIVLVSDQANMGTNSTVVIETKGLDFTPVLNGTTLNEAVLTTIVHNPTLATIAGNVVNGQPNAIATTEQTSPTDFTFTYDVRPSATSFAVASISNPGFFTNDFSAGLVFAARGRQGSKIKVNVTDLNGNVADYILQLDSVFQNYTISLTGPSIPAAFDNTRVLRIEFIADAGIAGSEQNDLIQVKLPGISYSPTVPPASQVNLKNTLINTGLTFFDTTHGLDPVTHFPYDSTESNGQTLTDAKFTQPTSIGFYLQILGDLVNGKINNGQTTTQNITEVDTVLTNLLSVQSTHGWNGLIPWLDLDPSVTAYDQVHLGDNANLAQSIAVMIGALELALPNLTSGQQSAVNAAITKANQFLNNQAPGYAAFVDGASGNFRANRFISGPNNGQFTGLIDRLANEFRGAIAFLVVRYPSIPVSVWNNLSVVTANYTDRSNQSIENLAYFDGAAFQAFWPGLRNDERGFIGFRNALDNALLTFADYSFVNRLPGFVSASQRPNGIAPGEYYPTLGIREIAEGGIVNQEDFLGDVGSTYSLAGAAAVNQLYVLSYLSQINQQNPALLGPQGFFDGARSNTELAARALAIDIGATILSLIGTGPANFTAYLRNRNLETSYNRLYEHFSNVLDVDKANNAVLAATPELPDRSRAVFKDFPEDPTGLSPNEGGIGGLAPVPTSVAGVSFSGGALAGGFGGQIWTLTSDYDATANQFIINYSAVDTPQQLKFEIQDGGGNILFVTTVNLVNTSTDERIVVDLPNRVNMNIARKIAMVIDQNATGDNSFNFRINAINFQHVPSSQNLAANPALGSGNVTVLPGNPPAQLVSSNGASTLNVVSSSQAQLNYNLSTDSFAGFSINYGSGTADLTALSGDSIVFGIDSTSVKTVKIEIDDEDGNRATLYATGVDVARGYYSFLKSSLNGSIKLNKVKRINFIVDQSSYTGSATGILNVEIGGLQFP